MDNDAVRTAAGILEECRSVLVFAGAGLSAESGVPTFRDQGGLWENHPVDQVATPEGFARDPVLVWRFYAERQARQAEVEPNPGHYALAEMETLFPRFLLVTQNVDNLSERAGSRKLLKIHGDLLDIWCTSCSWRGRLDGPVAVEAISEASGIPRCQACHDMARPGIVWFGEYLPPGVLEEALTFAHSSDALIVVGTSGMVSGGYGLLETARAGGGKIIEVNPNETPLSRQASVCIREPSGIALASVMALLR